MRGFTTIFLLVGLTFQVSGQQTPIYNLYFKNPFLYNPAYAGDGPTTQAFLTYRNQWVGIPEAPETQAFTIDGPVKENVGLGFAFVNDTDNIIGRTGATLNYSYKLAFTDEERLAFGLAGGITQNRIYFDRINANDDTDPTLLRAMDNRTSIDGSFGVVYQRKQLGASFAAHQLFANSLKFENSSQFRSVNFKLIRHYIATIQYDFNLKPDVLDLRPILLVRSAQGLAPQVELTTLLHYRKDQWLGLSYRHESSFIASVGTNFYERFSVGYSYEIPTSQFVRYNGGSHEFMIGYRFLSRSSSPAQATDYQSTNYDQLSQQNQEQYELIDQLNQRNERLEDNIEESQQVIGEQNEEIQRLRGMVEGNREARDKMIRDESVDLEGGSTEEGAYSDYYVVVGAFRRLENAKLFQQIIQREISLKSSVVPGNNWFLIYTLSTKDQQTAITEINRIRSMETKGLIIGNPWFYGKK